MEATGGAAGGQGDPAQDDEDADAPDGQTPVPVPAPRGKRRRKLSEVADDAITGTEHLMVADPAQARVRALFTGHGVGDDRVDLETFGDLIGRLGRFFQSLTESRPQLFALDFGHSVEVEIGPPEEEATRAAARLAELDTDQLLQQAAEGDSSAARLLASAIPETAIAGYAARELFQEDETDIVPAVLAYGKEVTETYKGLVRSLAADMVSLELSLPTSTDPDAGQRHVVASLGAEGAERYRDALNEVGTEETLKVTAVGTLTMADSGHREARLTLDKTAPRPPQLRRNRQSITARYTTIAGQQIRDDSLWDKPVVADFDMTRDRAGTTARTRPPQFVLKGARLR